ncbi:MAG: hypothetical protein ABJN69_02320 [Hellea sp.]
MKLVDFALYTPRPLTDEGRELEEKSQAIFTAIVRRLKRDVETNDFRKVNVMINSQSPNKYTKGLSTLSYHMKDFDIRSILNRNSDEQKNMVLGLGVDILKDVFSQYDLKGVSLKEIKKDLEENGFTNVYQGPINELDGIRARVKAIQGFDRTAIVIEVKRKRTLLKEIELFDLRSTSPFIFQAYLRKLNWISPNSLKLSMLNGDEHLIPI